KGGVEPERGCARQSRVVCDQSVTLALRSEWSSHQACRDTLPSLAALARRASHHTPPARQNGAATRAATLMDFTPPVPSNCWLTDRSATMPIPLANARDVPAVPPDRAAAR